MREALGVHALPTEMVFDHESVLVGQTKGWGSATGRALAFRVEEAVAKAKKAQKQIPVPSP